MLGLDLLIYGSDIVLNVSHAITTVETGWVCLVVLTKAGALDGGVPMSHVEFKKWPCRMSNLVVQTHKASFNREGQATH